MKHDYFLIHIQVIIVMILWIIFSVFSVFIFIHRKRRNLRTLSSKELTQKSEKWIYEAILNENFKTTLAYSHISDELIRYFKTHYPKGIHVETLIDIFVKLNKSLTGNVKSNLREFFLLLKLDVYVMETLYTRTDWAEKAKAISILAEMSITHADQYIEHYVNDPHPILRREARLAYISMHPNNLNYFIQKVTTALSGWEIINIINVIQNRKILYLLNFNPEYAQSIATLNILNLTIIKTFKLLNHSAYVLRLLNYSDRRVANLAIQTIGALVYSEALPLLILKYPEYEQREQIAILEVIQMIGSIKEKEFLVTIIRDNADNAICLHAVRALINIGVDIDEIKNNAVAHMEENRFQKLLAHTQDNRI